MQPDHNLFSRCLSLLVGPSTSAPILSQKAEFMAKPTLRNPENRTLKHDKKQKKQLGATRCIEYQDA